MGHSRVSMEEEEKYGQNLPGKVAGGGSQAWTTVVQDEYDDDDVGVGTEIEGEAVKELMRKLEEEISNPECGGGAATSWACPFVTINGNEESCGPSISDSSSTVMASFDITTGWQGLAPGSGVVECMPVEAGINESWLVQAEGIFWPAGDGGSINLGLGFAGERGSGESDDEWLERVLNSAGPGWEFEPFE